MAKRDQGEVVPKSRSFCNVMELDTALTAAMTDTDNASQGCEAVTPLGFGGISCHVLERRSVVVLLASPIRLHGER